MNIFIISTQQRHCTLQSLRNRIMDGVTNPDTQVGLITTEIVKPFYTAWHVVTYWMTYRLRNCNTRYWTYFEMINACLMLLFNLLVDSIGCLSSVDCSSFTIILNNMFLGCYPADNKLRNIEEMCISNIKIGIKNSLLRVPNRSIVNDNCSKWMHKFPHLIK